MNEPIVKFHSVNGMDNTPFFLPGPPHIHTFVTGSGVLHGRIPQPEQLPTCPFPTPPYHTTLPHDARYGQSPLPGRPYTLPPTQMHQFRGIENAKQDIKKQQAHQHEQTSKQLYSQHEQRSKQLDSQHEQRSKQLDRQHEQRSKQLDSQHEQRSKQLDNQHEQRSKQLYSQVEQFLERFSARHKQTSDQILIPVDKVERLPSELESLRTEKIERVPVKSEELLMLKAKRKSQALEATVEPKSRSTKPKHGKSVATEMKRQRRSQRLLRNSQKG